jgi:hypothetical protein
MYVVLGLDDIKNNNLFYQEKVKNTVMDNSNFIRLVYSNELFILNGVFITFKLALNTVERSFNKYKCVFDATQNQEIVSKISNIEKTIMNQNTFGKKTPIYRITDQLNNGFLKIFNEVECMEDKNEFILKIYGIWENECEYGITYKFINI